MASFINNFDFKGKVVAITGGGGYIGYETAKRFASLKANIALIDICSDLDEKAKELEEKFKVKAKAYNCNLFNAKEYLNLPKVIFDDFGTLNTLVLNAAFVGTSNLQGWAVEFEKQSLETFKKALDINLTSPLFLIQKALPYLKQSKAPSIVTIGSIYGFLAPDMGLYEGTDMGNPIGYAASKGGLIQATRWLSTVIAPEVRINCVSPGGVYRNQDEKFYERYVKKVPLGRMAHENDVANAIVFLASNNASYITGQHLAVDGGFSAW